MNRSTPQIDPKRAAYLAWLQERGLRHPVMARAQPEPVRAQPEPVRAQPEPVHAQPEPVRSQNVAVAFAVEGPLSAEERTLLDKMIAAMKLSNEATKVVSGLGEATALRPRTLVIMQAAGGPERGAFRDMGGVPTISTYHPRALLARPDDKRLAWDHLKLVLARLRDA